MAEKEIVKSEFSLGDRKTIVKGLEVYAASLARSITKEGDSDIGAIYKQRKMEVDHLMAKITAATKELF